MSNHFVLYTVLAYKTRREHQIMCENENMLTQICAERFGYEVVYYYSEYQKPAEMGYEPNWAILKMVPVLEFQTNLDEDMMISEANRLVRY